MYICTAPRALYTCTVIDMTEKAFKIGNTVFDGYAALAPMAGVADRAMREMCIEHGAAYCVGELVSAKGVTLGDRKSKELLAVGEGERPMALQIFGSDPEIMAQATAFACERKPSFLDINMGCPAPKVASSGGGSALLKTPKLCGEIVKKCVAAAGETPVTVKLRTGWDSAHITVEEVAKYCEEAGAAAITVHGRTRAQMYAPSADWDMIARVKECVSVPVIGNGDITSAHDAAKMYEHTGCDFVMVGRAAMGAPWLFSQINALLSDGRVLPEPPLSQRMVLMLREVEKMLKYKSERTALLEARKHTAWYMRGVKNAAKLRAKCGCIESFDDIVEISRLCLAAGEDNDD